MEKFSAHEPRHQDEPVSPLSEKYRPALRKTLAEVLSRHVATEQAKRAKKR